jgi:V/A-type H+-transporting ATPase subunit I
MFTSLPMQRATLYLVRDEAPAVALALGRFGVFEPEPEECGGRIAEPESRTYRDVHTLAMTRLAKIRTHLGVPDAPATLPPKRTVPEAELAALANTLGELWQSCSARDERRRHLHDQLRDVVNLGDALHAYEALDVDLGRLQGDFRFLDLRIGTVDIDELRQLSDAVGLLRCTISEYSRSKDVAHVVVAGLTGTSPALDRVLGAASFTPLSIPPEFGAHPQKVRDELKRQHDDLKQQLASLDAQTARARKQHEALLRDAAGVLALASPWSRASGLLRRHGGLAVLAGWVPRERIADLRTTLKRDLGDRFVMEVRDPLDDERPRVPSALRYPALLEPFGAAVRTYGVPRYGEVDPTSLFALSFVAMFGMMFGDVGHGFVIAAAGVLARQRLRHFTPLVVAMGAASMLFGLLYGSIFGYEGFIHPLWISPLEDAGRLLAVALYFGIGFIVVMASISIRNRLREKDYSGALLSGGGLAGIAFYLGLVLAAAHWLETGGLGASRTAMFALPLAVVLGYEWQHNPGPLGERIAIVVIEGFDTLLGYIANTLSFLRVAAFSLNHVALAIAVFTIANGMGPAGHWTTIVVGNVFILVLEGAIVTIQVLRLEYYEGFSRFFSGDGREFRPLRFGVNSEVRQDLPT